MNKITVYLITMVMLLTVGSCKKSNPYSWTFEGTTFSADVVTVNNSPAQLEAYNNNSQEFLDFTFNTLPTTSGSYLIVTTYPAANQMSISQGNLSGYSANYSVLGTDSIKATVTVTNGKIAILVPPVKLYTPGDTSTLTAHISQ